MALSEEEMRSSGVVFLAGDSSAPARDAGVAPFQEAPPGINERVILRVHLMNTARGLVPPEDGRLSDTRRFRDAVLKLTGESLGREDH